MLMSIPNLPSLTSEVPFDNNPPPATQATQATQTRSREEEMAAQYYAKRVEETPRPVVLPAPAAAIAPTQLQDGRYRSPYASTEPPRQFNVLAPMPMAPMAPMNMSQGNTPEPLPPRHAVTSRTSSESQTDERHEPPKAVTIPGNNQYTPGVHRVSHPGTPQPTGPSDGTKPAKPRPHVCLTCQRTFARREHLNRHELSHTKEKPFECAECSRCFSRRDLLLRHKQKLHLTNPYVRPRDRVKMGDGQDDGDERSMQPMAPMRSENDGINLPIAVHPSGRVQQGQDGSSGHHDGERGGPSRITMAHMRPALSLPHAAQPQGPPQPKSTGSAASLYYQKQDIDLSQLDLSRFRSFSRSPRPPGAVPTGPPRGAPPASYAPSGPAQPPGQARGPPQCAPLPVSPHQMHREAPRYVEEPGPAPINHLPEESGFHIPFAKRPRRDTDGRSRNNQNRGVPPVAGPPGYDSRHGQVPMHAHGGPPNSQYEPPHTLLDQLAIAAVPDPSPSYQQHKDYNQRGPPPSSQNIGMAQAPQNEDHEVNIWRSPGGTHRVVQFERTIPPIIPAQEALAPPKQQRSPSRKRSLQQEDEDEEGMKMQGGFRRSMRRALSMSMEDGQRPVIPSAPVSPSESKEARGKVKGKKAATPEKQTSKPNVRYVKAASSRSSLKETEKEKESASPVRGRKPSAKAKANEVKEEQVTPEKRGRGRPPKSANKATPASASARGKKLTKPVEHDSESEEDEEQEESGDEQAAVEEQLLQEEKRTTRRGREVKETKKAKEQREEEKLVTGRTFRSVRLQAKHMK